MKNNLNLFYKYGFILSIFHFASGILGYIFQILVGRILSPEEYAIFSAIMALGIFFMSPMAAFTMITSRKVAEMETKSSTLYIKSYYDGINKNIIYLSIALVIFFIIFRELLYKNLKLENYYNLILFIMIIVMSLFGTLNYAFLQGTHRFLLIGFLSILGIALKIILSYIYVDFGSALNGILSAIVTSLVFVYLLGVLFISNRYEFHDAPVPFVKGSFIEILKESLPVLIATISLAVMTQLDLVLVNYYFPSSQAGLYAAASVLGKAVLYIPGGLIIALFPMAAADKGNGGKGLQLLYKASLVTLLSCGMLACIYLIYGDFLIKTLYGADYDGAGGILALYGFAMLPLALVVVAEQYVIARGETLFSWLFIVLAPIQIATIMIWHTELWMILASIGFFGSLTALCGFTIIIYKNYFQLENFTSIIKKVKS